MNTKLQEILTAPIDGVELIINGHRNIFSTLKEYLASIGFYETPEYGKMLELDSIIQIKLYLAGFNKLTHIVSYDLDLAVEEAYDYLVKAEVIKS